MDANGTRFHLLLGRDDWGACRLDGADGTQTLDDIWRLQSTSELLRRQGWDDQRSEVMLPAQVFRFVSAPANTAPSLDKRRGAGIDRYGNWYWIADDESSLMVRSSGDGTVSTFWSVGDALQDDMPAVAGDFTDVQPPAPAPVLLRGLAVSTEHFLVVGAADPPGLLIFDLRIGGPPRRMMWPVGFSPFDLAAGRGGVWILDRDVAHAQRGRLWLLDRRLNLVPLARSVRAAAPPDFHQLGGASQTVVPSPRDYAAAEPFTLNAVIAPVAIAAPGEDSVLILDNGGDGQSPAFSQVWRFSLGSGLTGPFSLRDVTNLVDEQIRPTFSLVGHDLAVVDETLLVVSQDGDQTYAYAIVRASSERLQLQALPEYWPMRLFGGRGLVESDSVAYYDSRAAGELIWAKLVQQQRPRYITELTILTPFSAEPDNPDARHAFDGRDPDCVWHRLLVDGSIPPDTGLRVWSRAANSESELATATWQREPDPYQRSDGSELPFVRGSAMTVELLFQRARGRYLQLKLQLVGNSRSTPRLRALRAYYARFSYLDHYLPAIYREDADSASFLDRFLANLEGMYTTLEDRLEAVRALFDIRSAPAEDLAWLATWLGIVLDPHWEEDRQRLLIAFAPELFRLRGTRLGVIRGVRLASDACPTAAMFDMDAADEAASLTRAPVRVVEHFSTKRAPVTSSDTATFRAFLMRRYGTIQALNAAYGLVSNAALSSFAEVGLPTAQPTNVNQLRDWIQFVSVVAPTVASAHRFTVLVPTTVGETDTDRGVLVERVRRIVELEKPAHTAFDVKEYWAAFRVGEARLGFDSLLDRGSRLPALILGSTYLAETYLSFPQERTSRV